MEIWDNIKALERKGEHAAVDKLLKLANEQMNLFDPSEYTTPPEEIRQEKLRFLPRGMENHKFGPFYHGSPVSNLVMETGLGTKKTPTFGGFNTPYFPENVYFGTNPGIAAEYSRGQVAGMQHNDVINNIDEYLEGTDWDRQRVQTASEQEYDDFEYALERALEMWEGSDGYDFSSAEIADIIWTALRTETDPGVVEFMTSLDQVRPDEDFMYRLVRHGSSDLDFSYNLEGIDRKYLEEYREAILDYMIPEIIQHIQDNQFMDDDTKLKSQKVAAIKDKRQAFDLILDILKESYNDIDEDSLSSDLNLYGEHDLSKQELIGLTLAQDIIGWLSPEVLRGLGIISALSVGKANVPPIPKDRFEENKVRMYD